ncbi:hypothetical protein ITJ43_14810 [Microbacterium sp. VKM Ac-2870]|uniref:hypothetical protein n=1 Tax=Microbacterium sp. VKM Ac-2870 TaxID=2783825 RepID=UPI00188AA083|nr:hypothetical protein [Microbacterium sp. VKM Ac-2870]MBF4563401.1 hypothetical protein [Microbacterium sp. VKM Ac-2870]
MDRDEDVLVIANGDHFTVEKNSDGDPCIKIQNTAWVEDPRWLLIAVAGKHDRRARINELIGALTELRDLDGR